MNVPTSQKKSQYIERKTPAATSAAKSCKSQASEKVARRPDLLSECDLTCPKASTCMRSLALVGRQATAQAGIGVFEKRTGRHIEIAYDGQAAASKRVNGEKVFSSSGLDF